MDTVVADWTALMYACGAVGHLDMRRAVIHFGFLMRSTPQIAFWPSTEFGAAGPTVRLLFGETNEIPHAPRPDRTEFIGLV